MTNFTYCPKCWPYDLGEYDIHHRCTDCGTPVIHATPEKQIELLLEQNAALTRCLGEAMEVIAERWKNDSHPALRLVKGKKGEKP